MTTVYIGNLDVNATPRDLSREFDRYGRIVDLWIARNPPGFAFIEYGDPRDARDAVRDMDGRYVLDKRVRVEISRRGRPGKGPEVSSRPSSLRVRTEHRVRVLNLPAGTDWRALKDFLKSAADVAFVDVVANAQGDFEGLADFYTARDRDRVVQQLDGGEFRGAVLTVKAGGGGEKEGGRGEEGRERERSRSRARGEEGGRRRRRERDDSGEREREREGDGEGGMSRREGRRGERDRSRS